MAAGQQKKRLASPSVVSCSFQEKHRGKKKKNLEPSQNVLNMRAHISLEWDDTHKRAVAKREQIGITQRDMAPFIASAPQVHMGLADVFSVPQEIFELENLTEVLSYEVWNTRLSESERRFLVQFLPKGTDVDQTVRSLLMGENLLFGNPCISWGAALCSGNVHPDAILHRDRWLKANKRAYYTELQDYHREILENLQKLKDKWTGYKDPGEDSVEKKWRKGYGKHEEGNLSVTSRKVKAISYSKKEEIPHNPQVLSGNSTKYMSCIKVSRKQHQMVKVIKQSGDGIKSKSLNQVLGDIKYFHVQPYESFEEEERKKLHEYWLQLVRKDLPEAFAIRSELSCHKQRLKKCLEMIDRNRSLLVEDGEKDKEPSSEEQDGVDPESSSEEQDDVAAEPSSEEEDDGEDMKERSVETRSFRDDDSSPHSSPCQPLQRIPSLNTHHELEPMVIDSQDCNECILNQEIGESNEKTEVVEPGSSAKDMWQSVSIPGSYFPATSLSHEYSAAADLSLGQPQPVEGRSGPLIDLETDILEHNDGGSLLHAPHNEVTMHIDNRTNMFPFANHGRNELLPPFLKEQMMLSSYGHDHMKSGKHGLEFLTPNDCSPANGQYPQQFQEQQQPHLIEQRPIREKDMYMHSVMQKNVFSNGRYLRQEFFHSSGMQEWPNDPIRTASFSSPINPGLLSQNWFSGEQQTHNGWSGVEVSGNGGQCLGQGGNVDESLYSVLSQCTSLQSHVPYSSINSDPHAPERSFIGRSVSSTGDALAYAPQLNYVSSRELISTTSAMKANNASWMNIPPNQGSSIHDSVGKPFLRSWGQ